MKLAIFTGALALAAVVTTTASAAVVGITEGTRDLVNGTIAASPRDTSSNPNRAFDLDTLGSLGADSFEIYGRIVNAVDNFAFGFSSTSAFDVSWIFGGYTIDAGNVDVSASGFVSEGAAEKSATFNLLDANDNFSVVETLTVTTDIIAGDALLFSAGAGDYVLQIDGSGSNRGPGVGLYDVSISAVPLPASSLLLLIGIGGLGVVKRRKKT
ncbi:MAG: VPLPA-CTERM sorting domain-containing protein [Roseobacter sp.]